MINQRPSELKHISQGGMLPIERLPMAYIVLDRQYRVNEWNSAAEHIFGYTKQEALGKNCLDLLLPNPLGNNVRDVVRRVWKGDLNAQSVNENLTKDGRMITCEWSNTPMCDPGGKVTRVICLGRDITASKSAEQMLESAQRRYQAIFQYSVGAIFLWDDMGHLVDGNPSACELTGFSREELVTLHVFDLIPKQDRSKVSEVLRDFRFLRTMTGEGFLLRKDGETRNVEYRAVARIFDGLHLGVLRDVTESRRAKDTGEDITKRKQAKTSLRGSATRLRELSRWLVDVQEQERRHLARELHDEIGQVLSTIRLNLSSSLDSSSCATRTRLEESISIVDKAIQQVQSISFDLRPSMIDDLGLIATLRWAAERQAERANFKLNFAAESIGERLPADLEIACYRVAQEALTNIVRHAHARNVSFKFRQRDNEITIVICDDGVGFDAAAKRRRIALGPSLGLRGMQERAELLGGTFVITSSLRTGTKIQVQIPLEH
jgi:PAS domain S-box-containing protein